MSQTMQDKECVQFLQWALPRMRMRWPGFRKVRAQVCKRIKHRLLALNLSEIEHYINYLEKHPEEWQLLDGFCQITISRFFRDKMMFNFLSQQVLPELANRAKEHDKNCITIWSAGCGSGEEPYTVNLLWHLLLEPLFPDIGIRITGSDSNSQMLHRAAQACYSYSSIKNLPLEWREQAFLKQHELYYLKPHYRQNIEFLKQDVRTQLPDNHFDLVLCRNLVLTYYDEKLQCEILQRIQNTITTGGALAIGIHEKLPHCDLLFTPWSEKLRIYRKGSLG